MRRVTVVGGGLGGLTASISCAEAGLPVRLLEAHEELGGRARSTAGPYKANLGPHALYKDGPLVKWLRERELLPPVAGVPLAPIRFRWRGEVRRMPPLGAIPGILRLRGREAPVDRDFRSWAAEHTDERVAALLASNAGVYTFHHDPGELSAAFVWQRSVRVQITMSLPACYPIGGWSSLVERLERRARDLGVEVETGHAVEAPPEPPLIVATELGQARKLLGDDSLRWSSGRTLCLDFALRHRRGDPFVVSDLDEAGWAERYTAPDPSLAPQDEELVQSQMPIRPDETPDQAALRLERLLDASYPDWRERVTWKRRQVMDGRSGALDLPGTTWRDRPAVDRGDDVYLVGDMVAAPGLLGEVAWASAVEASQLIASSASGRAIAGVSGAAR
jgi:hypothetical protein